MGGGGSKRRTAACRGRQATHHCAHAAAAVATRRRAAGGLQGRGREGGGDGRSQALQRLRRGVVSMAVGNCTGSCRGFSELCRSRSTDVEV